MDNLQLEFTDPNLDPNKVLSFLDGHKVKVTKKTKGKRTESNILFTRNVGHHESGWMFTVYPDSRRIVCSGGPSTTFFGFNAWVSLAEDLQMDAIVNILRDKLNQIDGVDIDANSPVKVLRVEITHLYQFGSLDEIIAVEQALYANLVARYPGKVQLVGETLEVPGTLRVGLTKSATLLRIYPELDKFKRTPKEVPLAKWQGLKEELKNCLRVETVYDKDRLSRAGLSIASSWKSRGDVLNLVEKQMTDAGLRVPEQQDSDMFDLKLAKAPKAVRSLIEDWKVNLTVNKTGSWSRAQELLKSCGYDLSIPYSAQSRLAHNFAKHFHADRVYELPLEMRQDTELFNRWWEVSQLEES